MLAGVRNSGGSVLRRALALVACAALIYFAAGGSLFHQHTNDGPDAACHLCQALHMPVLAAASLDLLHAPELISWYSSLPQHVAPSNSFAFHRAGRAPPTA